MRVSAAQCGAEVSGMRALIVSYAFPPVGGAGVQRMLKLVRTTCRVMASLRPC